MPRNEHKEKWSDWSRELLIPERENDPLALEGNVAVKQTKDKLNLTQN